MNQLKIYKKTRGEELLACPTKQTSKRKRKKRFVIDETEPPIKLKLCVGILYTEDRGEIPLPMLIANSETHASMVDTGAEQDGEPNFVPIKVFKVTNGMPHAFLCNSHETALIGSEIGNFQLEKLQ